MLKQMELRQGGFIVPNKQLHTNILLFFSEKADVSKFVINIRGHTMIEGLCGLVF